MNMYKGQAILSRNMCDWQTHDCDYLVWQNQLAPENCLPVMSFDNAKVIDGKFTAGGAGYTVKMPFSILSFMDSQSDLSMMVDGFMATVSGTLIMDGNHPSALEQAILGVAIRKDQLMESVDNIPADAELPVSKDMIKNLLDMFISVDMDSDGDGEYDAASLGVQHSAIAGKIAGLAPN